MKQAILNYIKDGKLSSKDKSLLLVGLFAARREEPEMLLAVEAAVAKGNEVMEIAELISAAIISRGIPTWLSGIEAISKAMELTSVKSASPNLNNISAFATKDECIQYYQTEFDVLPKWIQYLVDYAPDTLLKYSNLRTTSLRDGSLSRLIKELLLYAINICDGYLKGIEIHKINALQLGADEDLLYEIKELCVLAVGLKAIFQE